MERQIIEHDLLLCTHCGACVEVCEGGALSLTLGRASVRGDDYCVGCGECISQCPEGALRLVWREALPFRGELPSTAP